ncbi:serine/threonine-protein kinase [Dictyobacter kobayashii]|uniref:non-specific serine/threonine protein kinase n=1 Tax=Dictyobacter kobayashii TaxID=2014872 RepID=A0A402ABH4_9CHLR|nr:serine/threonine-protein kinase [Dictyobacter kobayashii]GCE16444.1 hypothetical protein KDK_02440 [Dictyobacter kobayashii]
MIETIPSGTILHGRYRIERVLGSGGFGHVYLALDQMTNQQAAIKEYLVTGASGQEQLKHEARVLSQLHHPNLPAFMDSFIERGRYYVVLSYIEGEDLTDLIRLTRQRNEVIPVPQILSWILSICDGVMFMHSQRPIVIHRDIKPDNIRITPNGTAVLVDLGNAKAAADGARTLFFIRHQGTPGYAPPEQYPGGTGTDARSDVYALGGTLYFALTASEPPSVSTRNQSIQQGRPDLLSLQDHIANNPPEESPEANAARQFRLGVSKPAKPAPRHLRHIAQLATLSPEVLNALNLIIQKSMALRPRDRYQYVADFANDLKNVIAALPQPPTPHRPKDPNSTQPDLAEIYDTLQASKNSINQQQNPPMTPPAPPVRGTTMACPRCQNPLAPNASFCPRCGLSLTNPGHNINPPTNHASTPVAQADQTLIMSQEQMRQAALARTSGQQAGHVQAPPVTPQPNYPKYQQGNAAQAQAMAMPAQSFQSNMSTGHNSSPNLTSRPGTNQQSEQDMSRWLIIGGIAILVILIVLAFLIMRHV